MKVVKCYGVVVLAADQTLESSANFSNDVSMQQRSFTSDLEVQALYIPFDLSHVTRLYFPLEVSEL